MNVKFKAVNGVIEADSADINNKKTLLNSNNTSIKSSPNFYDYQRELTELPYG